MFSSILEQINTSITNGLSKLNKNLKSVAELAKSTWDFLGGNSFSYYRNFFNLLNIKHVLQNKKFLYKGAIHLLPNTPLGEAKLQKDKLLINSSINSFVETNVKAITKIIIINNIIVPYLQSANTFCFDDEDDNYIKHSIHNIISILSFIITTRELIYIFSLNQIYIPSISSITNQITGTATNLECTHNDEQYIKSLIRGSMYNLTTATIINIPLAAIKLIKLLPNNNAELLAQIIRIPFIFALALYTGQGLLSKYFQHARICIDCQQDWFCHHNYFSAGLGFAALSPYLFLSSTLDYLSINSLVADEVLFSTCYCLALLILQSKTINPSKENLILDIAKSIRKTSDDIIDKHYENILDLIKNPRNGWLIPALKDFYNQPTTKIILLTLLPGDFLKIENLIKLPPVQIILVRYRPEAAGLELTPYLQKIYGTHIYGILKFSGILNLEAKVPVDLYAPLRRLLKENMLTRSNIDKILAILKSAKIETSNKIDWLKIYNKLASKKQFATIGTKKLNLNIQPEYYRKKSRFIPEQEKGRTISNSSVKIDPNMEPIFSTHNRKFANATRKFQ